MFQTWRNSEFIRSVSTLMTGTVIAQAISYLIYPLITHLCSPEEMGDLGLYMRWVAFIAAIATARFDVAIPIPKENVAGFQLFRLALRIGATVSLSFLVFFCLYFTFKGWTAFHLFFSVLVVLSAYTAVWINSSVSWAVRQKHFKQISKQRIINSFGVNGFRYSFVLLGMGSVGLILGSFAGSAVSALVFIKEFFGFKKKKEYHQPKPSLNAMAKEYEVYPKVNLPHVVLDLGIDLTIASLIVMFFDKSSFGSFSHAYLMLKLPISIMGQSVGQVFFQHSSAKLNEGRSIYIDFLKTSKTLFILGIIPFTVLFFFGRDIFPFIFGGEWVESGRFAEWMSPLLFVNFVISPLSTIMLLMHKQRIAFYIAILVGAIQLFSFGVLPYLNWSLMAIIQFNFIILTVIYVGLYVLYNRYAKEIPPKTEKNIHPTDT